MRIHGTLEERYWARVLCGISPNDCWGWNGATTPGGYGRLQLGGGKGITAHRVSARIHLGRPPEDDQWVLHHCDNPPCTNPRHLYYGDHSLNVRDRQKRERTNSVLTANIVRQIVSAILSGEQRTHIAGQFGISRSTVDAIASGQNWSHLIPMRDREAMARMPRDIRGLSRGLAHGNTKLSDGQVREIRRRIGEDRKALADDFGVSYSTIWLIQTGRSRRSV